MAVRPPGLCGRCWLIFIGDFFDFWSGFTEKDVDSGGAELTAKMHQTLAPYSIHAVDVVSKCEESFTYTIEIPSLSLKTSD